MCFVYSAFRAFASFAYISYIHTYYIYLFPLSLSYFIILLASKYLFMSSDFDTSRTRCHFAIRLHMFPLRNSNFPSAKITLTSLLSLVQVFWLCPYSVLRQPW